VAAGTHVREYDDLRGREFRPVVQPLAMADAGKKWQISCASRSYRAITCALYLMRERPRLETVRRVRCKLYRYLSRSKPRVKITLIHYESWNAFLSEDGIAL